MQETMLKILKNIRNSLLILESLNIKTFTPYTNKGAKLEWWHLSDRC